MLVFPDAKVSRRDPAFRQNCRSLKRHQPSPSLRAAAQVDKVPVIGKAILRWSTGTWAKRRCGCEIQ